MGEAEAGRLVRALTTSPPEVALAFDAGALAALTLARDRRKAETVVLGVVSELAPAKAWAVGADRFATADDEAAVILAEHGIDGARVMVTGPVLSHAIHAVAGKTRAAARAELSLPADLPVVLVDTRGVSLEELAQVTLQLSLFDRKLYVLFDAGGSSDAAAQLRKQVPGLGLKGKLFGDTQTAPMLWRAADAVVGRATPRAVHLALALATPLVALAPKGAREEAEAAALADRRLGGPATRVLLLAAALEPFVAQPTRTVRRLEDGAAQIAELVLELAGQRDEILAESPGRTESPPPISEAAAADPEDLGGDDIPAARAAPDLDELRRSRRRRGAAGAPRARRGARRSREVGAAQARRRGARRGADRRAGDPRGRPETGEDAPRPRGAGAIAGAKSPHRRQGRAIRAEPAGRGRRSGGPQAQGRIRRRPRGDAAPLARR